VDLKSCRISRTKGDDESIGKTAFRCGHMVGERVTDAPQGRCPRCDEDVESSRNSQPSETRLLGLFRSPLS
jgi:hypothetical protein